METKPPNNWRSFDNSIIVIETANMRILHWEIIGLIRRENLECDRSGRHCIVTYRWIRACAKLSTNRLCAIKAKPHITIPHHYFVWNITHRASCLLPPDAWMKSQQNARFTEKERLHYNLKRLKLKKTWLYVLEMRSHLFRKRS